MSARSRHTSASHDTHIHDTPSATSSCRDSSTASTPSKNERPSPGVRFRSTDDIRVVERHEDVLVSGEDPDSSITPRTSISTTPAHTESPLPGGKTMMYRLAAIIPLLIAAIPLVQSTSFFGHASLPLQPVTGGPVPRAASQHGSMILDRRADTPTDVCFRWAQQSAIVNGTLYLYGGQASMEPQQEENTWNNDFLSLDLTKSWQISTPPLNGLPQPSGPPNVSLGYLWNSHESLFLYGGEFSWKPPVDPTPFSLWEYNIASSSWNVHSDPVTSSGESAPSNNDPVQRAAEGAGIAVPSLGRGFYFGGHQDGYTTEGWSQSVPRIYLQSLLEYTFPGYSNDQVDSLSNSKSAGSDGVYRNITEGGLQADAGFTQRADGLLIYVPGFGDQGILLALAGGTNETFTQMNNVNVYDIAKSSWYVQATSGEYPQVRVNPCAGVAAAMDGSSINIYMFGGQNLVPYASQKQYDDMWILSLPSFTWIKVDQGGQSVPPGRSGHTCNVWDAQMVMVGGYVGNQTLTCESPGIYVFDMSGLQWVNQFTATSATADDSKAKPDNNPFNQQLSQRYNGNDAGGLQGSYGYEVPSAVYKVIGGGKTGGATLTTPVNTATAGPLATGHPITYTVTNADGSVVTETAGAISSGDGSSGTNVGAIVGGVIAGVLFVVACYFAFCAWVYRKQLKLYKRHVEMSQAQARGEKLPAIPGLLATNSSSNGKDTSSDQSYRRGDFGPGWMTNSEGTSSHSRNESGGGGSSDARYTIGGGGYSSLRRNSGASDTNEDLLAGHEPSFVGVMLNPRRNLRVINQD